MPAFLLDTNHLSAALRKVSLLRERLQKTQQGILSYVDLELVAHSLEMNATILTTDNDFSAVRNPHRKLDIIALFA